MGQEGAGQQAVDRFEAALASRPGGHEWRRTSAAGEWRTASADGSEQGYVRVVDHAGRVGSEGTFEARVYRHETGPTPGPELELDHGPRLFEDPAEALEYCEANLSP